MTMHRIIEGDVLDGLRMLPDGCVQCTVTSPPYYGLRNYGIDGQIGLEETPEQFIQKMVEVFREVRRVTRDDGVLWLNLGDSYAGSGKGPTGENGIQNAEQRQGFDKSDSNRGSLKWNPLGGVIPAGYKAKDLMGIPWRVAFALQADGWYLRSAIPWIKRNCMPESTTDRPTSAIEYIFLMAKSAKYFYDGEAVRKPVGDKDRSVATTPYKGEGTESTGGKLNKWMKEHGGRYHPQTRNLRNSDWFFESWQGLYSESENPLAFIINPQARPELHFATFPDLLAETCIKAGTSEYGCCPKCGAPWERAIQKGTIDRTEQPKRDMTDQTPRGGKVSRCNSDRMNSLPRIGEMWQPTCKCGGIDRVPCVVLDPFMGSGTVTVVARELNRSSIGIELNPEYVKIIRKRLQADSQLDSGVVQYRFEKVPA